MKTSRYDTTFHDPAAKKKRRTSLFDLIVLTITALSSILMLLSYLAGWVDPRKAWVFAPLGLVSPLLYLLNLLLALWWVMRWKIVALLPALALLAGVGSLTLFFHPALRKHYDKPDPALRPDLRVMSYNIEGFIGGVAGIGHTIRAAEPDIVCLQEYRITVRLTEARIDTLLGNLPRKAVDFNTKERSGGRGVAIYTRFPILDTTTVDFGSGTSALRADLLVGKGDTLRVLNCHLQTTSLSRFRARNGRIPNDLDAAKGLLRMMRDNYRVRAGQADTLAAWVAASPYPVVVCGDFNDTPLSYAYHRIRSAPRGRLRDSFVEQGRGAASTYRGLLNLFRIDYVLHSKDWRAVSYDSPSSPYSDHRPVVVGLKRRDAR